MKNNKRTVNRPNKRLFLSLGAIFLFSFVSVAQMAEDYTPIQTKSGIPSVFLTDPEEGTKKNVTENKVLTEKQARDYYAQMNFFKSQLFQSGRLYLTNDITVYIDSIKDRLLAPEPKLKAEIKIFLTRYTNANAFCFPDGSIFMNSGLLAVVDNESELAFIIAHEMAHYAEQHNIKDLKKLFLIREKELNYQNKNSDTYRSLRFSRESEFDADAWALQLMAQAGYDVKMAGSALLKLKEKPTGTELDYVKIFSTSELKIDTSWITQKARKNAKRHFESDESSTIATGKLDDIFETHPDLDKRIEAINLMARNIKKTTAPERWNFNQIREIARFERIENNYEQQDYLNTVVNSLRQLEKYPDNLYLHFSIARALYWVSYYKEINPDDFDLEGDKSQNTEDFYTLYALFSNISLKDSKKLAFEYSRVRDEKYSGKENILFYMAVNTENYLGKVAARNYYRDYQMKFPQGRYVNYVKTKLQ
ncbi:MAG: M48 family metallopeptidase [Bacteroidota bacterium]